MTDTNNQPNLPSIQIDQKKGPGMQPGTGRTGQCG